MINKQRVTRPGCVLLMILMPWAVGAQSTTASSSAPPSGSAQAAGAQPASAAAFAPEVFATVDGQVISIGEYAAALRDGLRKKFYHGKVPEGELEAFRREVGEQLVEHTVLLREARRQAIEADGVAVGEQLAAIEERAAKHPQWAAQRERMLPLIRAKLEQDSLVKRFEERTRAAVVMPDEGVLRAYYEANPQRFTSPERFRISAILLKVEPSSPSESWLAASEEAAELVRKLRAGASFAELARLHSGDASGADGGDMGYLHRGMIGVPAQKAVDALQVGEITDPVKLLEGVGIFRLDERPPQQLTPFAQARERVGALWLREERDRVWQSLKERLRKSAVIHINDPGQLQQPAKEAANTSK